MSRDFTFARVKIIEKLVTKRFYYARPWVFWEHNSLYMPKTSNINISNALLNYVQRRLTGAYTPKSPTAKQGLANGYRLRDTNDRLLREKVQTKPKDEAKVSPPPKKNIGPVGYSSGIRLSGILHYFHYVPCSIDTILKNVSEWLQNSSW